MRSFGVPPNSIASRPSNPESVPAEIDAPTGDGLLLVEDAAPIRALAERVLRRQGYTVHSANDGHAALELWAEHRASIRAVITDVRMPGLDGRELVARLRADEPGLPVLYVSGYVDDGNVPTTDLATSTVFLEKPFTLRALLAALGQLIGPVER